MDESIRIRTYDGQYRIIGGDFQSMLALVRGLPKRRYQASERIWEIPQGIAEVQELAATAGYHVTSDTEMGRALPKPTGSARPRRGPADRILIRVDGEIKAIVGSAFRAMLDAVKAIEGRRFASSEKLWELPGALPEIMASLEAQGLRIVAPEQADKLPATPQGTATPPQASSAVQRSGDTIRIRVSDGEGLVVGGGFREMLGAIKDLEGRRFVSEEKLWQIPDTMASVSAFLTQRGFSVERAEGQESSNPPSDAMADGLDEMPPIPIDDDYIPDDQEEEDDIF